MTQTARRFEYDTVFDANGRILRSSSERHVFTRAELDAEIEAAYARGKRDELVQIEQACASAIGHLVRQMDHLMGQITPLSTQLREGAAVLGLAIGQRLADDALEQFGADRAARIATSTADTLPEGLRLRIQIAPQLVDAVRERITANWFGDPQLIQVMPDPAAGPGDIRMDWAQGTIVSSQADARQRIEERIQAGLLDQRTQDEEQGA